MQIEFEIDQQRLTRTSDAYLIEGSKNFVECIFSFSSDWAELDKWALFKRDNNTYEIYIEDNKCLVPIQCTSAEGEFTISVVGRKNAENVTGTASDKLLTVRGSEFVGGMGEEGRLTETYLVEVLGEVKDLREKAATSEANAAESAQNAKGYADKAKEYSESVNVYIPSVSQDGVMTWTNKAGLANPTPVNVKGERGEKGEQGAKGDTGATGAKGERGEQGPQGLQGAKGEKGEKGDAFKYTDFTAAQLAALKGPQGDRGLQGERGETGPRGATGPQGAKGDKGDAFTYADFTQEQLAGLKGPQGDKGLQGLQGERGERGLQGLQGIQGVKGDTGTPATVRIGTVETGAAGTSASVTNSGTASAAVFDFIIPKGDKGATGDRGPQGLQGAQGLRGEKGEKGDQGTGVTIKGKYDSLSALMAAHPTGKDGDAYMVGVNLYAWSGTEWIDCGNIQGAKGERGEQGPQGLQGAKGEKGEKGDAFKYTDFTAAQLAALKGPQGDRGLQGERGETGPRGATGPQGAKGDKGDAFTYADFTQEQLAGLKGPQGDKGLQGLQGERGERGLQGLQGIQGVKGDTGTPATVRIGTVETGAAGTSASVTNSGTASAAVFDFIIPKGDKGATGDRGPQGLQGAKGEKGEKGEKGDAFTYNDFTEEQLARLKGAKGDKGDVGPQGLRGEKGEQGVKGEQGLKGDTGPKGETGEQGAKGDTGTPATIKVGTVKTGAAGTSVTVSNSGTASAAVFDFVIPRGDKGDTGPQGLQGIQGATGATGPQGERGPQGLQGERGLQGLQGPKGNDGAAGAAGAAATIKVGVVTTGAAGTAAKVTNSGTTSAAVLDFVIPQGPKGDKGEQGAGSIVAVDSELSSTSTNPVQNKVVKAAIDTVKKNMSQGFQTVTDSIPTKVSALENDAEYLKKGANIWVERYYTYVKSGTSDAPQVHVAQYTTSTGSFVIDLGYFTSNLTGGQSLVFTAYIQSTSDTAGTLTINNAGTIKYIGAASDLAITKAGLLLTVLMTKDWNDVVTSILQASKLGGGA